jgi:hypothetical protein
VSHFPYDHAVPAQIWARSMLHEQPLWPGEGLNRPPGITPRTALVSAGSCFSRVLAAALQQQGFHYLVTEPGPAWLNAEQLKAFHYGVYSARYGYIYTALQFWQLIQRAWGEFTPADDCWPMGTAWVDPFRPRIQPGGFSSPAEMRADRVVHLAAVRAALLEAEVLILTLGMTECWRSRHDGAVYPVCPGRDFGVFDPERYGFENLDVTTTQSALCAAIEKLHSLNPGLRWILTLSPVPMAVTAEARHVLEASSYSKAVLRVAIEQVCRRYAHVSYFPAYELVMQNRPFFFAGRQVRPEALSQIMDWFQQGFVAEKPETLARIETQQEAEEPCDEELLLHLLNQDFQQG